MTQEIADRALIAYMAYSDCIELAQESEGLQDLIERIMGRQRLLMELVHCLPPKSQIH